jgi:hypothetical protein
MRPIIERNRCDGKEANTDSTDISSSLVTVSWIMSAAHVWSELLG